MTEVVKAVDKFVADNQEKKMASFVVLLDETNEANQTKLEELAKATGASVPLTIAGDGAKGPGAYKLSPDVPLDVYVSNKDIVRANFPFKDPAPDDSAPLPKQIQQILTAAQKMLSGR